MSVKEKTEYYVYVYIDPRNLEEFYYGKGKGNRKEAHLSDDKDSEKAKRIKDIKKEGLNPIIKVIAKDLTEREAFLIEKTLIWKLGKTLTNVSSGQFADKFRPHDTMHKDLYEFDFKNGIFYVNIGEGETRCWEDCKKYGFLAAGQGNQWSDPLRTLEMGDIVVAYLKGRGFVGIGRVIEKAVRVDDFRYLSSSLNKVKLKQPNIFKNSDNEKSDFLVKIEWIKAVDEKDAKMTKKFKLFTTPAIKASLQNQPQTVRFLEEEFKIKFEELLNK